MRLSIEGLDFASPVVLIVAKTPEPGRPTTSAHARLGEVLQVAGSRGEALASRIVFDYWTRHEPGPKSYGWLLPLVAHERFSECLSGGVLMAEETGSDCRVVGFHGPARDDFGAAQHVAREIYEFLERAYAENS